MKIYIIWFRVYVKLITDLQETGTVLGDCRKTPHPPRIRRVRKTHSRGLALPPDRHRFRKPCRSVARVKWRSTDLSSQQLTPMRVSTMAS